MKTKKIRTRFAPSPTGYLHIGGLRTALYEYLFTRKQRGEWLVRIEDTDQTREVEGAVENLLKSLHWAGLEPAEGVFLDHQGKVAEKGNFGPYQQSQRLKIYQEHVQKLLESGDAYYCFCSPERLEKLRQSQQAAGQPTHYDRQCLKLTPAEVKNNLATSDAHVVRMKIPAGEEIEFNDLIRGPVKFNSSDLDDQVILKSDGFPTYHLASVVDDHLMKISHVIRGEEWLPSTPKHILLYRYFGWDSPEFAHLPLLLNPDKSKLAKRQGDVAVEDYRAQGYLPAALLNFVALLGWNPGTEQEIFSLEELIKVFDLNRVHKAGAVFNREKLDWLNGEYLKKLPPAEFRQLAMPYLQKNFSTVPADLNFDLLFKIEQERISKLVAVGEGLKFVFGKIEYNPQDLVWKKSTKKETLKNLELLVAELENYGAGDWQAEKLEQKILKFIADNNLKNGDVLWPMRFALTGEPKSPPPFEVADILGQKRSLERLRAGIANLQSFRI